MGRRAKPPRSPEVEDWGTGRARLPAIFAALNEGCTDPKFCGCIFANAAAEFHDVDDPIPAEAYRQKQWMQDFVQRLAAEAGAPNPHDLASQLCALINGATVLTHLSGNIEPLDQATAAAQILIDAAIPKSGTRSARPVRKRIARPRRQH